MNIQRLKLVLSEFKNRNILVVGDLMIDEYLWGNVDRISPEAPVQVVDVKKEEYTLGGAGNVVRNLVSLGSKVHIASVIDDKENGKLILGELERLSVSTEGLFKDSNKISSRKIRVMSLETNQQILRIDKETKTQIKEKYENRIINFVKNGISSFDAVIVSDYLKGVLTNCVLSYLLKIAQNLNKPTVIDPKGKDYHKYQGATILVPNKKEVELASEVSVNNENDLEKVGNKLLRELKVDAILITRGKEGMSLFESNLKVKHMPARAKEVYDVTGAGDTVVSVLGLGITSGLSFIESAMIANIAAGIVVGKVGAATVTGDEIIEHYATEGMDSFNTKAKNLAELKQIVKLKKNKGEKIVFTNGCFDLLHVGHIKYLQKAKQLGDVLILGLNSDDSVRKLKGNERPIISETERARILSALNCVDYIIIFNELTPIKLIQGLRPHILVKGADYKINEVVGRDIVESYGGQVKLIDLVEAKSTSNLIKEIVERYK